MRGYACTAVLLATFFVVRETEADSDDEQGPGGRASPMQWAAPDPVMDQVLQTIPLDLRLYQNDMASSSVLDSDPEVEEIMRRLRLDRDPPDDDIDLDEGPPPDELEQAYHLPVGPTRVQAFTSIGQRIEERLENAGGSPWEPNGHSSALAQEWNPFTQFSRPADARSVQGPPPSHGMYQLGIAGGNSSHPSQYLHTDLRMRGNSVDAAPSGPQRPAWGMGFTIGASGSSGARPRGSASRTVGLRRRPAKSSGRKRNNRATPDTDDR